MSLKAWAFALKRDAHAVWLCVGDPRTPWYAKAVAVCVAAYALSPIDLIPDFIPILGYLDDVILVPLGLWVALRLIPPDILAAHRAEAEAAARKPVSRAGAVAIIAIWCVLGLAGLFLIARALLAPR